MIEGEEPDLLYTLVAREAAALLGAGAAGILRFEGERLATVVGGVALAESFPLLRERLRGLLGRNVADLLFLTAGLLGNILTTSPLGLAAAGTESGPTAAQFM